MSKRQGGIGGATYASKVFASWIAANPTPEAPAWMRTLLPGFISAMRKSACHAVSQFSGTAAACSHETWSGLRVHIPAGTEMYSAYAPPVARPNLREDSRGQPCMGLLRGDERGFHSHRIALLEVARAGFFNRSTELDAEDGRSPGRERVQTAA